MVYGDLDPEVVRLITEGLMGLKPSEFPEVVVIGPYRFQRLLGRGVLQRTARSRGFSVEEVKNYHTRNGKSWMVSSDGARTAFFFMSQIGVAFAADTAILLSAIDPVEEVIFLGSAACLNEQMRSRDFNLPTRCLRTEKVLDDQFPPQVRAEADRSLRDTLADHLSAYAEGSGSRTLDGLHATVPYVLMETTDFLEDLKARGVFTLDMELSVYYTILNNAGKRVAGMIMGGDRPLENVLMGQKDKRQSREMGRCLAGAVFDYLSQKQ